MWPVADLVLDGSDLPGGEFEPFFAHRHHRPPFPIFRVTQMSFKVRTFLLAPEHHLAIFGIWGQIFWGGIFQDFTHGSFGDGGGVL